MCVINNWLLCGSKVAKLLLFIQCGGSQQFHRQTACLTEKGGRRACDRPIWHIAKGALWGIWSWMTKLSGSHSSFFCFSSLVAYYRTLWWCLVFVGAPLLLVSIAMMWWHHSHTTSCRPRGGVTLPEKQQMPVLIMFFRVYKLIVLWQIL